MKGIYLGAHEDFLAFDTDQGLVAYAVDGDCCSESRFTRLSGVANLLGSVVEKVDPELWSDKDTGEWDYIQTYTTTLHTPTAEAQVVFENQSNGHYGGWMSPVEGAGEELLKRWGPVTEITEDWEAKPWGEE